VKTKKLSKQNGEPIMKKTIITSLVAIATLGFSGASFAVNGGQTSCPPPIQQDPCCPDITLNLDDHSTDSSINADCKGPAAGNDIGQVAYDAPAVGNDYNYNEVIATATATQNGQAHLFNNLSTSGAFGVASGVSSCCDPCAAGAAGAASADYASVGNVTIGDVSVDLSNVASAVAVGGNYTYQPSYDGANMSTNK